MKDFLTSLRKRENDNMKDFEEKHLIYMAAQVRFTSISKAGKEV